MKIVLCTHNKNKLKEFREILGEDFTVLSADDVHLPDDIEETGTTFEENALIKARAAAGLGYLSVADDSGLEVDALNGAPGVYSARYSGLGDAENNARVLRELEGIPTEQRTGRFVCAMAAVWPDGKELVLRECCEGIILTEERGENGFGYDPLFWCAQFGKTFAELTMEEKNAISHRGKAVRKMAALLTEKK